MRINGMLPKDLLLPSWLDEYERKIDLIHQQLIRLNSNTFILERIFPFRFDLFTPFHQDFWVLVEQALFESSVMIVWRVGVDSRSEGLTLQQLKNEILRNLKSDFKDEFQKLIKAASFEKTISKIKPTIGKIRHDYIAHFNLNHHVKPTSAGIKERTLLFSDLKEFQVMLNSIFWLLCFDCRREVLPIDYLYPSKEQQTDIEELLDAIVKNSGILNLPEKDPMIWPKLREKWEQKGDIKTVNRYRLKFGLPEV
jgi:hypothetical protein